MRRDFGKKPWLYPLPVLIVGTYDENGVPDAMNAPVLEELPVTWECELVRITEEGNVLGRLVNVSASERVLTGDGRISMEKFEPLVFDHATYDYLKVDGVAGKAFEVGKELK